MCDECHLCLQHSMQPDSNQPLPTSKPPLLDATALANAAPPPLPSGHSQTARWLIARLLSLCLGLFLAHAIVSLVDDSLNLFGSHVLTGARGVLFLFALLISVAIYCLMGLAPMIPKRVFLPGALFTPVAGLALLAFAIYFFTRLQQVLWIVSFWQVIVGLLVLRRVQNGWKFHWPLFPENQLLARSFSARHLCGFILVNLCVLLPAVVLYLGCCSALAVEHFSDGFVALRPNGLMLQARKYVRDDGKTIRLIPMAHIGDAGFYRSLSESFQTNAIILMEGVSDSRQLLTNRITYRRAAASLGVAEQQKEFHPTQGEIVHADLDIEQFATNTIDFLNLVMLIQSKGLNDEAASKLSAYSPPAGFEAQLFDDLLTKRNQRLLQELHSRLPESVNIIVPWGAAHMPEIARAIQSDGFRVVETRDYLAIRFRSVGSKP